MYVVQWYKSQGAGQWALLVCQVKLCGKEVCQTKLCGKEVFHLSYVSLVPRLLSEKLDKGVCAQD